MTKFADLTQEQFDALVQTRVEEALSSRDEADARRKSEEALAEAKEVFEQLKAALEAKQNKIEEYEEALANLDTDPTAAEVAANDKIVALEADVEEWKRRAEVAEAALTTLALEEAAASRMAELEEAGVALDNEASQSQYAKVRDMSDDEFEAYKSELLALRSKYSSGSEEPKDFHVELSELSADEIKMIAQSLGCDPSDSECISLVKEVAQKMAEVSKNRRNTSSTPADEDDPKGEPEKAGKETASKKESLSLSDAIARSLNQDIRAAASYKEEVEEEWTKWYASKRGEKKEE